MRQPMSQNDTYLYASHQPSSDNSGGSSDTSFTPSLILLNTIIQFILNHWAFDQPSLIGAADLPVV